MLIDHQSIDASHSIISPSLRNDFVYLFGQTPQAPPTSNPRGTTPRLSRGLSASNELTPYTPTSWDSSLLDYEQSQFAQSSYFPPEESLPVQLTPLKSCYQSYASPTTTSGSSDISTWTQFQAPTPLHGVLGPHFPNSFFSPLDTLSLESPNDDPFMENIAIATALLPMSLPVIDKYGRLN